MCMLNEIIEYPVKKNISKANYWEQERNERIENGIASHSKRFSGFSLLMADGFPEVTVTWTDTAARAVKLAAHFLPPRASTAPTWRFYE